MHDARIRNCKKLREVFENGIKKEARKKVEGTAERFKKALL